MLQMGVATLFLNGFLTYLELADGINTGTSGQANPEIPSGKSHDCRKAIFQ